MLLPRKTMANPSMTNPDRWLNRGQFREMYDLKRGSSVKIRKPGSGQSTEMNEILPAIEAYRP